MAPGAMSQGFKPKVRDKGLGQIYFVFNMTPTSPGLQRIFRPFSYTSLCRNVSTSEYHFRIFKGGSIIFKYGVPVIQKFLLFYVFEKCIPEALARRGQHEEPTLVFPL